MLLKIYLNILLEIDRYSHIRNDLLMNVFKIIYNI